LFYALGGDETVLNLSLRQWNAITRQLELSVASIGSSLPVTTGSTTRKITRVLLLWFGGPLDPGKPQPRQTFRRHVHRKRPSGPELRSAVSHHALSGNRLDRPCVEQDGVYLLNTVTLLCTRWPQIPNPAGKGTRGNASGAAVVQPHDSPGDTPISLSATALLANAYLYDPDKNYRDWIVGYVDAWRKRIEENQASSG